MTLQKPEPRQRVKARKKRKAAAVRKRVRSHVVEHAEWCCERCGIWCRDHGHAHHKIPRSRGGQWSIDNIEHVCADCHAAIHAAGCKQKG